MKEFLNYKNISINLEYFLIKLQNEIIIRILKYFINLKYFII